jgi:hypothetical protein
MGPYNESKEPFMERYSLDEQKLVYRVLHSQLMDRPELIDSSFLHDLQTALQQRAQAEGVDIADHGAWDEWLGNTPVSCDVRVAGRRTFSGN